MANDALNTNPPNAEIHITTHGSDWLWAVTAVMILTDLILVGWHFMIPRGQRLFHQLGVIILTTAAIAYFSMASNLGATPVATEFSHIGYTAGTSRQIWYVRYIDWVITTPALLLELVLVSGLPLSDITTIVFFDIVMIVTGLVGALVSSSYKWGYYAFGCASLVYIWWVLLGPARASAGVIGAGFRRSFTTSAGILAFLWILYPIAWGLADGSSRITPDSEMIFYGILDLFAKPVFLFIHLLLLSKLDLTALQLYSGKFTTSAAGVSAYDREKNAAPVATGVPGTTAAAPGGNTTGTAGTETSPGGTTADTAGTEKKGFFSRRGRYDATAPATGNTKTTAHEGVPRRSEATVTSQG